MITLPDFSGLRVHVIGDAIRDVYTQAKCLGAASKSPTLVYEKRAVMDWTGGAGVVAAHCRAAGAKVLLTTADETVKERVLVEGVKVAEFHTRPMHSTTWPEKSGRRDVVIFADFGHGMFSSETIPKWLDIYAGALTAADSQTTDICWGNILDFAGCDLLFANQREADFALRSDPRQTRVPNDLGVRLLEAAAPSGTKAVFLKLGAQGLVICSDGPSQFIPAYATQPIVDPIGAGDALLAYATLTYAVTKDLAKAGQVGSLAAAEACAHEGNEPVTLDAVKRRASALG